MFLRSSLSSIIETASSTGLLVTFVGHISLLLGHDFLGVGWFVIFAGIFVVWFVTVQQILQMPRFGPAMQRRNGWGNALTGAPSWVRCVAYIAFIYGMIN